MSEITFIVEGMKCSGCEDRVRKALLEFPGVESVRADHQSGQVAIACEGDGPNEEEIRQKVTSLGYRLTGKI